MMSPPVTFILQQDASLCNFCQQHCHFMVHQLLQQQLPATSPQAILPYYETMPSPVMYPCNITTSNIAILQNNAPPTSANSISPHNVTILWLDISPCDVAHLPPCTVVLLKSDIALFSSPLSWAPLSTLPWVLSSCCCMTVEIAVFVFAFGFFLSPTKNITGCWQEVQLGDPWKVPFQIQPINQLSRDKLISLLFYFIWLKDVVQSPMPISIILMTLIQPNSQQQLLPQNS